MALLTIGNNHMTATLQEGWTVEDDSYGLYTGTCVFEIDESMSYPNMEYLPSPGDPHPISFYSTFMFADKIKRVYGSGKKVRASVTYVGVYFTADGPDESVVNITQPNVDSTEGTSTEPIENHPNFFVQATGFGDPIAGVGTGTTTPTISPIYEQSTRGLNPQDKNTYYKGNNGSHFVSANGSRFVGFLDPNYRRHYGKKSYLSRITSWQGVLYTSSSAVANAIRDRNTVTMNTNFLYGGIIKMLPSFYGTSFSTTDGKAQLLLTNVGVTQFSTKIYKITYTLRYNKDGYPDDVYANSIV